MAFSEDIIQRIGLDSRPWAKGLRSVRGSVAAFSKETNAHITGIIKGWAGLLGAAGIAAGLKEIFGMARKAREEGKEFSEQGWISAENASILNDVSDTLSKMVRTMKEFGAYALGSVGKFFRQLGAFSVTGSWKEAGNVVDKMAEADSAALTTAKAKVDAEKEILDLKKKQLANETALVSLQEKAAEAQTTLTRSKEDRSKFTLSELASSRVRFSGQLAQDQFNAQRILAMESQAAALKAQGYGPQASKLLSRSDDLRKGLVNVVESERFPFKSLEKSANEQTLEFMRMRRIVEEGKLTLQVKNAP